MIKNHKTRSGFRLKKLAVCLSAAIAAPMMAQSANAQDEESLEEIVVTGSRIQRKDYNANSPTVTVDSELFADTSTIGIETVLNQLPQFVPAFTEFTSTTNQASADTTPGASIVNLRGLGSFRTLTLIDGRRAQPINASLAVDTNSIPSSAIERVEIISGGASAVYGADAVAGVVNFILKDDYEGMEFSTRYGATEEGDGEQFQISGLIGADFADGRGNVMFGAEHATRSKAYDRNRSWLRSDLSDPLIAGTEGVITETYIDFGSEFGNRPTQAAIDSIFTDVPACTLPNGTGDPCGNPTNASKVFVNRTADGTGTVFTGGVGSFGTNGRAGSYRYDGPFDDPEGSGEPFRKIAADGTLEENNLSALTTVPLERYSFFGRSKYEINDHVTAYLRGNFAQTITETANRYSPAVRNWTATIPVGFEGTLWEDSLNADGITTNPAYTAGGTYGLDCPTTGGCTESQAFPLPAEVEELLRSRPDSDADIKVHRVMDYLPERQTLNRSTTFQLSTGLEGELDNGMVWDAGVSHGANETISLYKGFGDLAQYNAVLQSPNYGVNFQQLGISPTSSGRGECTSGLPIFRDFQVSQDCIDTVGVDLQASSRLTQTTFDANLAGDLFDIPTGTVQFAVGADYRRWEYSYINDNLNNNRTFISQVIGQFAQGNTKDARLTAEEIYGELLIPVVKDLPAVQELNLELGGRYSDYSTSGGIDTFKVQLDWVINDWTRMRGGFNRATRAPHIAEFFLAPTQSFAFIGDPCSQNYSGIDYSAHPDNGAQADQTLALCQQLMTPTAAEVFYNSGPVTDQPNRSSLTTTFEEGNPEVQPETADTWTWGVVLGSPFENPWLSGLSATVDYYKIEIEDIIAVQSGTEIWRQCVISNDPNSDACGLTFRDPFDGRLTQVAVTYTNQGLATFSGVDISLNWSSQFADLGFESIPGGLSISSQITTPIDRDIQVDSTADVEDYNGTLGCGLGLDCSGYDFQSFTTFNYFNGPFTASLRWNYYPEIDAAAAATDPETRERGVIEDYSVFSLSTSYDLNDTLTFRAVIDNLFDNEPPLQGGDYAADGGFVDTNPPGRPNYAAPSTDARYDQLGRRFSVGLTAKF